MSFGRILLIIASCLTVVGAGYALTLPDPWWWILPLALVFGYQGIIIWGVLSLKLSMFVDSVCCVKTEHNHISLTFDDGPDPVSTPLVLTALKEAGVKASFFVIGKKAERYPDLVRKIAEEGHELAIHSYAHELYYSFLSPRRVEQDIRRTKTLLHEIGIPSTPFFRPPVGQASPRTALGIKRAGVHCIGWSVRGGDGVLRRTKEECLARVKKGVSPGAIVLLHDAWQGRSLEDAGSDFPSPAGVRALPELLRYLHDQNYKCLTLSQLLPELGEAKESIPTSQSSVSL